MEVFWAVTIILTAIMFWKIEVFWIIIIILIAIIWAIILGGRGPGNGVG